MVSLVYPADVFKGMVYYMYHMAAANDNTHRLVLLGNACRRVLKSLDVMSYVSWPAGVPENVLRMDLIFPGTANAVHDPCCISYKALSRSDFFPPTCTRTAGQASEFARFTP